MKRRRYLGTTNAAKYESFSILSAFQQMYMEKMRRIAPCMISPNMTPKRNGNEITVKTAGLNSLYVGVP